MRSRELVALLAALFLCACQRPTETDRLHDLFTREWETRLAENPLLATSVGVHDTDDRLPAMRAADLERRDRQAAAFLAELDGIDATRWSVADAVSADIFRSQLENARADYRFGQHEIPFNADWGFYSSFARLPFEMPFATLRDYENYLARLRQWPRYVDDQIDRMREGLARGMTQPRLVLDGIEVNFTTHLVDDPATSVFWTPFAEFPVGVPESERERLRQTAREVILGAVVRGYRALQGFFASEYLPSARTTLGAYELPNGRAYYAQKIEEFTTLDTAPEAIHDLGLREVERIRDEMERVIQDVGFAGTFAEFLEFLRTDPRFYAKTPEELLRRAAWIAKTMDGRLPALFKTLPRLPYTVEPVPPDLAPKFTSGRYVEAPVGSTQPGKYWVNTYALETRPFYNQEALTLHEAVPGHHLQIALNQELADLPPFRRFSYISAFGEGWGLYSEWLGLEAGFYTDAYSNFGRLTYEMWRACRLVVDTGLHAMGWSRERAMDYLAANTALSRHEVRTETDRYISWPGQALAYKLGELKIRDLRRRAETALGPAFDVRDFHDAVLRNGSIPLDVLDRVIAEWIEEQQGKSRDPGAPKLH
ncbi:MAG: DUF885 domain-containing protein [Thermoanaerobaculia bacterium]